MHKLNDIMVCIMSMLMHHDLLTLQSAPIPSDDVFAGIAAAKTQHAAVADSAPLKTPPKWFRRPCGARFAVSYMYKCHV